MINVIYPELPGVSPLGVTFGIWSRIPAAFPARRFQPQPLSPWDPHPTQGGVKDTFPPFLEAHSPFSLESQLKSDN